MADTKPITVEALVKAPLEKTWKYWNDPKQITQWCAASDDWHAPSAENDLRANGKFKTRMEAKDGSFGFDWEGVYTKIVENKLIEYTMSDGRKVKVTFESQDGATKVTETFDPESQNPADMQREGWQAILNSFKKHTESK